MSELEPGPSPNDERVAALEAENRALRARVAELEARFAPPPARIPPPPSTPPVFAPVTPGADVPERRDPALSVEQFVGRRIVPLVGAVAVLGAIGYFVSKAIELGWFGLLSAPARFAVGLLVGLALLGAGEIVRRRGAKGAAVGLDAAGVGAVMVTVSLGVFTLQLFDANAGALMAAAAGVLGAAWSVRSGSPVVGLVAVLGLYGVPASFGIYRDAPLLGGILLAVALSTGLATHAVGGVRFAAVRFFALAATAVLGAVCLGAQQSPMQVVALALCWWAIAIAESAFAALRGRARIANAVVTALASVALVLVEAGNWPSGAGTISAIDFLPMVAGGLLLGVSLFLRGFAVDSDDASADPEVLATSAACATLSRTAGAFALALGIGGTAFLVMDSAKGLVVIAAAASALWIARKEQAPSPDRASLIVFDVVGVMLAWTALFVAAAQALGRLRGGVTWGFALPFSDSRIGEVRMSPEIAAFAVTGIALHLMPALGRRAGAAFGLTIPALVGVAFAAFAVFPGPFACVALAVSALVVARVPRAPLAVVLASIASLCVGGLTWNAVVFGAFSTGTSSDPAGLAWLLAPLAVGAITISNQAALGRARTALSVAAVCAVGAGAAMLGTVVGAKRGVVGFDALLAVSIALGAAGVVFSLIARTLRRTAMADGGIALACASVATGSLVGLMRIFESSAGDAPPAGTTLGAIVVAAIAAFTAHRAARAGDGPMRIRSRIAYALAMASVAPYGALLISALFGRPIAGLAAVAWIASVGVVEIVVGFRRGVAALRWAGLWSFLVLVLRLFFVDLAEASAIVRIALLFVSGMVLVGTGILYARRPSGAVRSDP